VTVIDGSALNAYPGLQTVTISGATPISAAYGRTDNVEAWVGDATYTRITYDADSASLVSEVETGTETAVPAIAGSDMWLKEFSGEDSLRLSINVPEDVSLIVISDGTAAAPSDVSITWPLDNSTPFAGPLLIAGGALLLLGLALLIWALIHMRTSRGPRRKQIKQPKMPKLPRQPRYKPRKPSAVAAPKGRRATRRFVAVVPAFVIGSLVLSGCSTGALSDFVGTGAAATPTVVATPAVESEVQEPAITRAQVEKVIADAAAVAAKADTDLDAALIATRLDGPALELRLANYKIRKENSKLPAADPIPAGTVEVVVPQQSNDFPRVVFAVVRAEATVAPVALMLVQADARSNYKISYAITLEPDVVLPEMASAEVGAARLSPDFKLLQFPPASLSTAYGDILMTDTESKYYATFDPTGDTLRTEVGLAAKKAAKKKLPDTAKLTYTNAPGAGDVIPFATVDSGAIVAVQLDETETVRPVEDGAEVSVKGAVKALSGESKSTKGLVATYSDQLLFYIPSANEPSQVVLLGFTTGLVSAKEYKKK
jgi:hypothetical protein